MLFDTHAHLNFSVFKKNLDEIIKRAKEKGVEYIVVPGTDVESSKRAVEIANRFDNIFAAVGVHPHHSFQVQSAEFKPSSRAQVEGVQSYIGEIEKLLKEPKVVAVGEVGMDKHYYKETKYQSYRVTEEFLETQKEFLTQQIRLAIRYKKSLILHNREAVEEFLEVISKNWSDYLSGRTVFHCCEPDERLLKFAIDRGICIGVDGDVTYRKEKQEFVKKIPLDRLVLETDSPLLLPEPLRSQRKFPNTPSNLVLILESIANLLRVDKERLAKKTFENSKRLFRIEK